MLLVMCVFGNEVDAAGMPRVAAPDTLQREPATPQAAEALDGLQRVTRAGRVETAVRAQQRAHCELVEPDEECGEAADSPAQEPRCQPQRGPGCADGREAGCRGPGRTRGARAWIRTGHTAATFFQSSARASRSSEPGAPRARLRALTTRSTGGSSRWWTRKDSRITRRILLRSTELPAVRTATASPSLGPFAASEVATVTPKKALPRRFPRA